LADQQRRADDAASRQDQATRDRLDRAAAGRAARAIGNLKRILDRFSRRGIHPVTSQAHLAAGAFNLLKICRATLA
jgi:hypothetical protein